MWEAGPLPPKGVSCLRGEFIISYVLKIKFVLKIIPASMAAESMETETSTGEKRYYSKLFFWHSYSYPHFFIQHHSLVIAHVLLMVSAAVM